MSSDGRYIAFSSDSTDLVENAPPGRQIYLRDTCAGAADACKPSTILVSADARGGLVGAENILPSVSSSGRFVAFLAVTPSHSAIRLWRKRPLRVHPTAVTARYLSATPALAFRTAHQ